MSQRIAENLLNPLRRHLSDSAKQRLRWMYTIERECDGNITYASKKLNVSREWLTKLHRVFVDTDRDPCSLEPKSRAPHDTSDRLRIPLRYQHLIVKLRTQYPAWGKEKISRLLKREHAIEVPPTTVGRYLTKHRLVDFKLSLKNEHAWKQRRASEQKNRQKPVPRERVPRGLKDAGPGALIAKDMKLLAKPRSLEERWFHKGSLAQLYWYQHTMIDSCSRRRAVEVVRRSDSQTARDAYIDAVKRFPFNIAALTADNGGENCGTFALHLQNIGVRQYWSRPGTPTDNPRVERSHLSDDIEFNRFHRGADRSFEGLKKDTAAWEQTWNNERPHQALGYLTPTEYEKLWITNHPKAIEIQTKWNTYLAKQSKRLRTTRKEKREGEVASLNAHLTAKLGAHFIPLKV